MTINSIDKLKMLTCIDEKSRQELISNAERNSLATGQEIFKEHDVAENMYIIISGRISIYVTDESGLDIELGVLSADAYFGEQGILSGSTGRRNASAMTLEDTELMIVPRQLFQTISERNPDIVSNLRLLGQNQLRHRLMQESELFRSIYLGIPIQRSLSEASFSAGDLIYQPGDNAHWFYLVLWGAAEVFDGERMLNKLISSGDFFGEAELIAGKLREQSAMAKTELLTLKIESDKFLELFGDNPLFRQLILKKSSNSKPSLVMGAV